MCGNPAYLQTSYVYYLKYTELKSFFGHRVLALKPVHWLQNPSGCICLNSRGGAIFHKELVGESDPVIAVGLSLSCLMFKNCQTYVKILLCKHRKILKYDHFSLFYILHDLTRKKQTRKSLSLRIFVA